MLAWLQKFLIGIGVHVVLWFVALKLAFPALVQCGVGRQEQAEVGLNVGANSISQARLNCGGTVLEAYKPFVEGMVGIYDFGLAGLGFIGVVLFLLRRRGQGEGLGLAVTFLKIVWPAGAFVWALARLFLLPR